MEDRYIIECTCVNKDNDFGMNVGDVGYFNKNAQTYKYKTKKFSEAEWHFDKTNWRMIVDKEGERNPYSLDCWTYSIPITPKMNNAKIYKRLSETKNVIETVEKVGDFTCKILVLKTVVEELKS